MPSRRAAAGPARRGRPRRRPDRDRPPPRGAAHGLPPTAGGRPVQRDPPREPLPPAAGRPVGPAGGARRGEAARGSRRRRRARPFDLARGPLLRALLLRLAAAEHVLLLTIHHIARDGWSLGVLVRELAALYARARRGRRRLCRSCRSSTPTSPSGSAAGCAATVLEDAARLLARAARRRSAGLELPADRPRPPCEPPRARVRLRRSRPSRRRRPAGLGRREGATLFMVAPRRLRGAAPPPDRARRTAGRHAGRRPRPRARSRG